MCRWCCLKLSTSIPRDTILSRNLQLKFHQKSESHPIYKRKLIAQVNISLSYRNYDTSTGLPPVDLYLISEKSIWKYQVRRTGFLVYYELDYVACKNQFQNWFLQAKNPVSWTGFFQLDFLKFKYRSTGGMKGYENNLD